MGLAQRIVKDPNLNRKKKLLSKYTKKEVKICSKENGKITLVNERRLFEPETNPLGEPAVTFLVSIPELEAMIKSAKKTIKTIFKKSGNGACIRHLNQEITMMLFEKEVG